jgi:hypothetical protein
MTQVSGDVAVEPAGRAGIRPEGQKVLLPIWPLQVQAVVAQENSVSVGRIVVSNQVLRLGGRELDSTAYCGELVAHRHPQGLRTSRWQPHGQEVDIRAAHPCSAGRHGSVQVQGHLAGHRRQLVGNRRQHRLERLRNTFTPRAGDDHSCRRDPLRGVTHRRCSA